MAWEAHSGLKHWLDTALALILLLRLNGLGSPFGIETLQFDRQHVPSARLQRLNGLGSPFGIETLTGMQ